MIPSSVAEHTQQTDRPPRGSTLLHAGTGNQSNACSTARNADTVDTLGTPGSNATSKRCSSISKTYAYG